MARTGDQIADRGAAEFWPPYEMLHTRWKDGLAVWNAQEAMLRYVPLFA
jgi:hypothetical protein